MYLSMGFGPFHRGGSDSILAGMCGFVVDKVVLERIFLPITWGFPLSLSFCRCCMLIRISPTLYSSWQHR